MSDEPYTADGGRIVIDHCVGGSLWRGWRGDEELVVALSPFAYARVPEFFDAWFRFEVPGIAPLAFLGYPDGASPTASELRALPQQAAVLAEVKPHGKPLATAAPLDEVASLRLGIELCDVMHGWIERRGHALAGIHPETLYVDERQRYTGSTPRVFSVLGNSDVFSSFDAAYYGGAQGASEREMGDADAAHAAALLVWFAASGKHAFVWHEHLHHGPRQPFEGSAAIGALVNRVLDSRGGVSLAELRAALERLAGAA